MKDRIDILWGWEEIAAALGVSVDTARALERDEGLPVYRRRGKTIQSTREALQGWAQREQVKPQDSEGRTHKHD